jgi:hypothetical protein
VSATQLPLFTFDAPEYRGEPLDDCDLRDLDDERDAIVWEACEATGPCCICLAEPDAPHKLWCDLSDRVRP